MSILYTINKGSSSGLLKNCLAVLGKGDGLLFIEDGVYHCLPSSQLDELPPKVKLYALREDLQARGLLEKIQTTVQPVNTKKFVQLCCHYDKVVSWF